MHEGRAGNFAGLAGIPCFYSEPIMALLVKVSMHIVSEETKIISGMGGNGLVKVYFSVLITSYETKCILGMGRGE